MDEGGGLESRRPSPRVRGFESLSLRHFPVRGKEIGTSFEVEGEGEEPWINLSQ